MVATAAMRAGTTDVVTSFRAVEERSAGLSIGARAVRRVSRSRQRVGPNHFERRTVMENVLTSTTSLGTRSGRTLRTFRTGLWIGRVLLGLCAALLLFDAIAKLLMLAPVIEGTGKVGYTTGVIRPLGVVLALSTLLHLIPRTQFIGALLLTAYLGGATATHVRLGQPFWVPVAMGAIVWIAYALRNPSLRALIPLSSQTKQETH
jgi:hypothetical protein